MLNAKLTATGRHSVRLSPPPTCSLFLLSRHSLLLPPVLSLYRNSLSALSHCAIPNKWWEKKKDRPDQDDADGREREKGRRRRGRTRARRRWWRWKRITSGSPRCISMNLKLFFVRAPAASIAEPGEEEGLEALKYICIHTYIERRQS